MSNGAEKVTLVFYFYSPLGPPSARSSAAPSPVPSMRYDALEGGTPYTSNFYQGKVDNDQVRKRTNWLFSDK